MAIKKIKKQNVSDAIFGSLRQEIINGVFRVGDKLPSTAVLSEQFGVSVASIKLALQRLTAIGLIETVTGQGSFVLAFDPYKYLNQVSEFFLNESDISEMTEFRMYFEMAIVELAIKKAGKENFRNMENILVKMDEAMKNKDINLAADYDYQFHLEISKAAKNSIFILAYELFGKISLRHAAVMTETFEKQTEREKGNKDVHWRLYRAMKDKDLKACRSLYEEMLYFKTPGKTAGKTAGRAAGSRHEVH